MSRTGFVICTIIASVIALVYHYYQNKLDNQSATIEMGGVYLHSFDWNLEDPFKKKDIDTVRVLEINGDYVKWVHYHQGHKVPISGKIKIFKHCIRPLNTEL